MNNALFASISKVHRISQVNSATSTLPSSAGVSNNLDRRWGLVVRTSGCPNLFLVVFLNRTIPLFFYFLLCLTFPLRFQVVDDLCNPLSAHEFLNILSSLSLSLSSVLCILVLILGVVCQRNMCAKQLLGNLHANITAAIQRSQFGLRLGFLTIFMYVTCLRRRIDLTMFLSV